MINYLREMGIHIGVYASDLTCWLKGTEDFEPRFELVKYYPSEKKYFTFEDYEEGYQDVDDLMENLNFNSFNEFTNCIATLYLCQEYVYKAKHANKNDNWLVFKLHEHPRVGKDSNAD